MNAKRTEPRVHCYQRPLHGGYVPEAGTTPDHLRAVFDAERQRLADAAPPPPPPPPSTGCAHHQPRPGPAAAGGLK